MLDEGNVALVVDGEPTQPDDRLIGKNQTEHRVSIRARRQSLENEVGQLALGSLAFPVHYGLGDDVLRHLSGVRVSRRSGLGSFRLRRIRSLLGCRSLSLLGG